MLKSLSPRARGLLGLSVIIVAFVLAYFFAPHYDDSSGNVTGDAMETPVPTITSLVSSLDVRRTINVQTLHVVVKQAMLAKEFSDDSNNRKRNSPYTVRLMIDTRNTGQSPVGFKYPDQTRLIMPDGTEVRSRLASVESNDILPQQMVSGYVDFPVPTPVSLSALKLHFLSGETLALSA